MAPDTRTSPGEAVPADRRWSRRALAPWHVLRETVLAWLRHRAPNQSAALAFYTLISLTPMLVLSVALAGAVLDETQVQRRVAREAERYLGPQSGEIVEGLLEGAARPSAGGAAATALGVATLLFGATIAFAQLQESLNNVWEVEPEPGRMLHTLLRKRVLSFAMVLVLGSLLMLSVTVGAVLSALTQTLEWRWDVPREAVSFAHNLVSFVVLTIFFAAVYRILPDAMITWREVALGAVVTSLLFALGRWAIGLWMARNTMASPYGAAGSLVVLLLWIYYSSLIFLFGAELTRVSSRRLRPRGVRPAPGARRGPVANPLEAAP